MQIIKSWIEFCLCLLEEKKNRTWPIISCSFVFLSVNISSWCIVYLFFFLRVHVHNVSQLVIYFSSLRLIICLPNVTSASKATLEFIWKNHAQQKWLFEFKRFLHYKHLYWMLMPIIPTAYSLWNGSESQQKLKQSALATYILIKSFFRIVVAVAKRI